MVSAKNLQKWSYFDEVKELVSIFFKTTNILKKYTVFEHNVTAKQNMDFTCAFCDRGCDANEGLKIYLPRCDL